MNWSYLLLALFGMVVFTLIVTTVLFYIHHHIVKSQKIKDTARHPTEGRYFTRFVPYELKAKYRQLIDSYESRGRLDRKVVTYATFSLVIGLALTVVLGYLYYQRDRFIKSIELTESELASLPQTHHGLAADADRHLPVLNKILRDLSSMEFVFVSNPGDDNWSVGEGGRQLTREYRGVWREWLKRYNLKSRECHFAQMKSCLRADSLAVVLPGQWPLEAMDEAIKRGQRFLVVGPPAQIFAASGENSLLWRGMRFEAFHHQEIQQLIVRGDRPLTLGFDAGLEVRTPPLFDEYRVLADDSAAISARLENFLGGSEEARLVAQAENEGRLVWLDFVPLVNELSRGVNERHLDAIVAAVFRYLLRQPVQSIAHWPQGAPFAAFIAQDLRESVGRSDDVAELAQALKLPITFAFLSDTAQLARSSLADLAKVGEVVCLGDSSIPFPNSGAKEQTLRLARCVKVLNQLTGKTVQGFHPPDDLYTLETLDAVINNRLSYVMANIGLDRFTPVRMISRQTKGEVILLASPTLSGDKLWWSRGQSTQSSALVFQGELHWLKTIGGVYQFFFSDRQAISGQTLSQFREMVDKIRGDQAYLTTPIGLSQWWSVRRRLLDGEAVPPDLLADYKPVRLSWTEKGEFIRENLTGN